MHMLRTVLASLLFAAACSAAQADQSSAFGPPPPPGATIALGIAPAKVRAPYDVQVLRGNGDTLPTYASRDRFYVQGNASERYTIRVTNPTARRVEAVVTVDGLDVIDGNEGDLRKRGYVVPPYGEVRIEGFRTSQADVATFRFSSVDNSYAGKQGKARNVGVIAVAIFEEQRAPEQQIIVEPQPNPNYRDPYDYTDDLDEGAPTAKRDAKKESSGSERVRRPVATRPADPTPAPPPVRGGGGGMGRVAPANDKAPRHAEADYGGRDAEDMPMPPTGGEAPRTNRPGLGTEFGEQRYSAATFTRFVRAGDRPIAIAELRYNNAAGLAALGINAEPLPDAGEIMTRETADPFPGDHRFSAPPSR